jgi:hypothetical protein
MLKANYIDKTTFQAIMSRKASQEELQKLVVALSVTVEGLKDKSREIQFNDMDLPPVAQPGNILRPSSAAVPAVTAARCLVCDKLQDDDGVTNNRPSTQPSKRRTAGRKRPNSPNVPSLNISQSQTYTFNGEMDPQFLAQQNEIMIMRNSLELPPITDNSRPLSIDSGKAQSIASLKNEERIRTNAGGVGGTRHVQNTR